MYWIFVTMALAASFNYTKSFELKTAEYETNAEAVQAYETECINAQGNLKYLKNYIQKMRCSKEVEVTNSNKYQYQGHLTVWFLKPIKFSEEQIKSHFFPTEQEAKMDWNRQCANWKNNNDLEPGESQIYESCGKMVLDTFYRDPQAVSTALRITTLKTASCECRLEVYSGGYVYNLIRLNLDGTTSRLYDYRSKVSCLDARDLEKSCLVVQ